jgi:hypothetical protein
VRLPADLATAGHAADLMLKPAEVKATQRTQRATYQATHTPVAYHPPDSSYRLHIHNGSTQKNFSVVLWFLGSGRH